MKGEALLEENLLVEQTVADWYFCKESKESKEAVMELAKVTSKGQITIPLQIRKRLKLKEGDKVFFLEEKGRIFVRNAAQVALETFQDEMAGEAATAGFSSEDGAGLPEKQIILDTIY